MVAESSAVVMATMAHRPFAVAAMSGKNFLDSLNTHKPAIELTPAYFPALTSIFDVIEKKFGPGALAAFRNSAQMKDTIPHSAIEHSVLIADKEWRKSRQRLPFFRSDLANGGQ